MSTLETMTLDEVEAALAALRTRRTALKSASTVAQRKIVMLARRRERLMQQVHVLDAQMAHLRGGQPQEAPVHPPTTPQPRRTRRSQAQVADTVAAILACVKSHTVANRATIIAKCHLSPANASLYLRQLCDDGKLLRRGEKRATTYTLAG